MIQLQEPALPSWHVPLKQLQLRHFIESSRRRRPSLCQYHKCRRRRYRKLEPNSLTRSTRRGASECKEGLDCQPRYVHGVEEHVKESRSFLRIFWDFGEVSLYSSRGDVLLSQAGSSHSIPATEALGVWSKLSIADDTNPPAEWGRGRYSIVLHDRRPTALGGWSRVAEKGGSAGIDRIRIQLWHWLVPIAP